MAQDNISKLQELLQIWGTEMGKSEKAEGRMAGYTDALPAKSDLLLTLANKKELQQKVLSNHPDIQEALNSGQLDKAKELILRYIIKWRGLGALQYMDEIRKEADTKEDLSTEEKDIVFGVEHLQDGTIHNLTEKELIELLYVGLDEEHPDLTARDRLKYLLEAMLEYAGTRQDLAEDPVASETLKNLKIIYDYLQKAEQLPAERLEQFLQQEIPFMATARPAGIEDLMGISSTGNSEIVVRENGRTKITFEGRLAIDEQKIHEMIRLAFTEQNPYKAKKGLNLLIQLPFTQTMKTLGRKMTDRNRKEFSRQLRKEILPTVSHTHMEVLIYDGKTDANGKRKTEPKWLRAEIGGGTYGVDPKADRIYFRLNPDYAAYLNTGAQSQYSSKTLLLGNQKNPLPYYLAQKLQDQYFHDGNRKRQTHNIISVKKILEACKDLVPTFETVQETDPGHWVDRIREPIERALNEIESVQLFKWGYCKAALKEATKQEQQTRDYRKWELLYITFQLIGEEPEQADRLQRKQIRIEEAQAKKALEDAKTIVEADKIQKRKKKQQKGTE